jgi:hypothetical protein
MISTENEHLVAIDAGAPDARVVVCMPPKGTLSEEGAISFAAHLVAKANAALAEKGLPITTPRTLFDRIETATKKPIAGVGKQPDGRIFIGRPVQFFTADDAVTFAAALVAVADPDANMLEHVSAVVQAARGGRALERELRDPRAAVVNLSEPRRAVRLGPIEGDATSARAFEISDRDIEEAHAVDVDEVGRLRRMKGGA